MGRCRAPRRCARSRRRWRAIKAGSIMPAARRRRARPSPTPTGSATRGCSGLFEHMLGQANRGLRRKVGEAVRLIDSTGLRLAGVGAQWAQFSAEVCGAKAHVVYDPDLGRPLYHMVTAVRINDIVAAKAMPIEAGATYVFDLGY